MIHIVIYLQHKLRICSPDRLRTHNGAAIPTLTTFLKIKINLIMSTKSNTYNLRISTLNADGSKSYKIVPITAKDKPKREVVHHEFTPSGMHKNIPKKDVKKDDKGNIIPDKFYAKRGESAIKEYRRVKKMLDDQITETYKNNKGFAVTCKVKRIFRELPSMILSAEQRKEKVGSHHDAQKVIRNANKVERAKNYPLKNTVIKQGFDKSLWGYYAEKRRITQAKQHELHENRIEAIRKKLFSEKVDIVKVHSDTIDPNVGILKRDLVKTVSKSKAEKNVRDIAEKSTNPPTKHVFALNKADKMPCVGQPVKNAA